MVARRVLTFLDSRLLLLALMAGYLVVAIMSHGVPLPRGLEPLLAFMPWLLFGILMIRGLLIHWGAVEPRPRVRERSAVWRSVPLWLLFAAVGLAVWVSSDHGNVSLVCTDNRTSCAKVNSYDYRSLDGGYARRYPLDEQGARDLEQPWVMISEETYVAEVGTILRRAIHFGTYCLFFAFAIGEAIRLGIWRQSKQDWW
ncbi:hypothetical protein ETD86_40345 [Nonomuraea turkmeniaca]|uniref:Uncharacterized protein n=1 Tax=Nonomuraea turkmeniaca TaxID=103838 RepID=A0A5S4F2K1_9ACTN|nr:hypothetical protein [Nonomuraea turkmeniaca]TMR10231.1 hypothetical protein ETD86_40345 [Nonomuraea turkmeniaca]